MNARGWERLRRYLWVGLLLVDLKDLPNKHLLNMDVAVVGDVGGDTASAMHHFFDASPQVGLSVSAFGACTGERGE